MVERKLSPGDCSSARALQSCIDALGDAGGRLVLPAITLTLDRGLELRSKVELVGQDSRTVLRKGPSRTYPLAGFHNYGMCDVPLQTTEGLDVGMTVSILDDKRWGFYETFARITWIDGNWVGLDHGIEGDYVAEENPRLTTAYPLIFGHGISDAAVRHMTLEGNWPENPVEMGGCRGSGLYLACSRRIHFDGVVERDYNGEGLGFQMCSDIRVSDCECSGNSGNGFHPGSGSTNSLFERCAARHNRESGFFFCVRAAFATVRNCEFTGNGSSGISIGTRDCHNLIESCLIAENKGPGINFRGDPPPVEPHSCLIRRCRIERNGAGVRAQVDFGRHTHDVILEENRFEALPGAPVFNAGPSVKNIFLQDEAENSACAERAPWRSAERPNFLCGSGAGGTTSLRHLP